jgi:thioredoxin reductase (NADPH)
VAELIGKNMEGEGVKFSIWFVLTKVEMVKDRNSNEGKPTTLKVTTKHSETGKTREDMCNKVLFAIGRNACTNGIGAHKAGIVLNALNG